MLFSTLQGESQGVGKPGFTILFEPRGKGELKSREFIIKSTSVVVFEEWYN
jgi:hypothetical protein